MFVHRVAFLARPKNEKEYLMQILDALELIGFREGLAQMKLSKVATEAWLPRS